MLSVKNNKGIFNNWDDFSSVPSIANLRRLAKVGVSGHVMALGVSMALRFILLIFQQILNR